MLKASAKTVEVEEGGILVELESKNTRFSPFVLDGFPDGLERSSRQHRIGMEKQ